MKRTIQTVCYVVVLLMCAQGRAVPITLFQDTDTYLSQAKDIVIAKCVSVPKQESQTFDNGLYPADVEVLMVLKGERKLGPLKIATIYSMEPDHVYLLMNTGGLAFDTDFLALGDLSVVPIPKNFNRESLKDKGLKEQAQKIFARYLYDIERQLAPLKEKQVLLLRAVHDRTDNVFESDGDLHITATTEITTKAEGSLCYFDFPKAKLEWSQSSPGKDGYLYRTDVGSNTPLWEFAVSEHRELNDFDGKPLKVKFYGLYDPGTGENAVPVKVGQIILARTTADPKTVYLLKLEHQEKDREAVTARYVIIKQQ